MQQLLAVRLALPLLLLLSLVSGNVLDAENPQSPPLQLVQHLDITGDKAQLPPQQHQAPQELVQMKPVKQASQPATFAVSQEAPAQPAELTPVQDAEDLASYKVKGKVRTVSQAPSGPAPAAPATQPAPAVITFVPQAGACVPPCGQPAQTVCLTPPCGPAAAVDGSVLSPALLKNIRRSIRRVARRVKRQVLRKTLRDVKKLSTRDSRKESAALKAFRKRIARRSRVMSTRFRKLKAAFRLAARKLNRVRRGLRGAPGPAGRRGPMGPRGVKGSSGARGRRGPPGRTGKRGSTGRRGSRGPKGRAGPRGRSGPRGPRGFKGRGSPGKAGPRGPSGSRGPQGARGARGARGPKGRPGITKTITRHITRHIHHRPPKPSLAAPRTNFVTKYGPNDGRDHGYVNGRKLVFFKKLSQSVVRLMYYDNMRVYQHRRHGAACRWEMRVDGAHCPSGRIAGDAYIWGAANIHRPRQIMGYCKGLRKGHHTLQVYVSPTPGYRSDCYTGWYSQQTSWTLEATEVPPNANRKGLTFITAYGPNDGRDRGFVNGRTLRFRKRSHSTYLRLTYNDNLRTYARGGAHSCRWLLKVDGRDCPSGRIGGDAYIWGAKNNHRPRVITGYCRGIRAGMHRLQVYVTHTPHYGGDCYTGWYTQQTSWTLEALEVSPGRGPRPHYFVTKYGPNDGRDVGYVNGRLLHFTKRRSNSAMRLLYYDNLRTYTPSHRGKSCRWEIRVDGRRCPSGMIAGDSYVYFKKNNHRPRTIVGYCRNIRKGRHRLQVYVSPTPGYRGSDCYTGWYSQQTSWTLEATEI